jgi:hypothetical protein
MRWKPLRRRHGIAESSIVADCERFLTGQLLGSLSALDRPVPQWVWINTLAHGSEADLERLAGRSAPLQTAPSEGDVWRRSSAFLAARLLERSRQVAVPVHELQRAVILPIELRALRERLGPSTVFRLVIAGLTDQIGHLAY